VARATLYFLLRYPGQVGDAAGELQRERVSLLLDWHRAEPAEEYERHRNAAVAETQGNRNPLIDQPQWAERIDFSASFGTSSSPVGGS
jgi:endonuclease G, mitochondrial